MPTSSGQADTLGTVLVVEDSPAARDIVMRILQHEGYLVVSACNGREAMNAVDREHPDVVLLDVMMPEMDGLEVLAALRNQPATRELPVILLTALSDEGRKMQARQLGASDYLVKASFSYDDLLNRIGQHVKPRPLAL